MTLVLAMKLCQLAIFSAIMLVGMNGREVSMKKGFRRT
jgi:hypothetical protein